MTTAVATPAPATVSPDELPRAERGRTTAWWAMMMLITTEAMIFAVLIASYFFLRAAAKEWPLGHIEPPELEVISLYTVVLLGSSAPIFWAEAAIQRGQVRRFQLGLLLSFIMGTIFLINQGIEYHELKFGVRDNAYGSIFYAITGLHGSHVFVGLLMNLVVQVKATMGRVTAERHITAQMFSMYWHFVDVVWIFVFSSLYVSAHIK